MADTNTQSAPNAAKGGSNGLVEIDLLYPVEGEGRTLTTLSFRRPTAGDYRRMGRQGNEMEQSLWLIGTLAGLSPREVDALDGADIEAASTVIEGFTRR
jgi:hypothetical protein